MFYKCENCNEYLEEEDVIEVSSTRDEEGWLECPYCHGGVYEAESSEVLEDLLVLQYENKSMKETIKKFYKELSR